MNKLFQRLSGITVCLFALISCAAIIPKQHLIPKDQLTGTMQKQFPLHWEKGGGLLGLTIDQPQLTLNSQQNRLALSGHFIAHVALIDIDGDFASSSMLHYDSSQRAVFLQDVKVDTLRVKQQGNRYTEILRAEVNRILKDYASSHPIYRFKTDELVVLGMQVDVANISVVQEGLMLQLHAM